MTTPGLKALSAGRTEIYKFKVADLHVEDGWNIRDENAEENRAYVRALADSMLAKGYDDNAGLLLVQLVNGKVMIREGHCRFAAIKLANEAGANITEVPCQSVKLGTSKADLTITMMRAPGKEKSPFEYAAGIKRLRAEKMTDADIAKRLGRSLQWLQNMMLADEAPATVRDMIAKGEVSPTEAVKTIRREGATQAEKTLVVARDNARAAGKAKITNKQVKVVAAPSKRPKPIAIGGGKKKPEPMPTPKGIGSPAFTNALQKMIYQWQSAKDARAWVQKHSRILYDAIDAAVKLAP